MENKNPISEELLADLRSKGVDIDRTLRILELINQHPQALSPTTMNHRLPSEGDSRITDRTELMGVAIAAPLAVAAFEKLNLSRAIGEFAEARGGTYYFSLRGLRTLGILLYPQVGYGVLNGGSATTYADEKKNRAIDEGAFEVLREDFFNIADRAKNLPKGITPAYVEKDGSPGPSFLLLKMRSLLIHALEYRLLTGDRETAVLPLFQMTSLATDGPLQEAYQRYRQDPLLAELIAHTHSDPTRVESAQQGLLAALSGSDQGWPRKIFDRAYGQKNRGLALPGGHGENFRVLEPVYRKLRGRGIRFVYVGNVDNSGFTVDPVEIALLALQGAEGAFNFSWRTPLDVKGGVLVETEEGRLSVADIGQAISAEEVAEQERRGGKVLFNCATGLFDLDYLVPHLDTIRDELPIRLSEQDKEAGRYAQAEQTTWEILSLMKHPLILAVAKEKRFIAAKMLMETLLAGPLGEKIEGSPKISGDLRKTAALLRRGMENLLETEFGFTAPDAQGRRRALGVEELTQALRGNLGRG
jgi:hypothetical protein